jgi:phosphoribosylformylglycinamidine cyclo-ligase
VIEVSGADLAADLEGASLADRLLAPTRIYVRSVLPLTRAIEVHALAHITGGGITENLPRVLPEATRALVDLGSWRRPAIFQWLQSQGGIAESEMRRTFNCGLGMVVCVAPGDEQTALTLLKDHGEDAWVLGEIQTAEGEPEVVYAGGTDHG